MPTPQNASAVPSITISGRVFTDLANLKTLVGHAQNTNRSTLREPGGTAGYTPSGTKRFIYDAVVVHTDVVGAAGDGFYIGYADNDMGANSATAATNPKYAGNTQGQSAVYVPAGAGTRHEMTLPRLAVPNGKLPFIEAVGTSRFHVTIYGYEVD